MDEGEKELSPDEATALYKKSYMSYFLKKEFWSGFDVAQLLNFVDTCSADVDAELKFIRQKIALENILGGIKINSLPVLESPKNNKMKSIMNCIFRPSDVIKWVEKNRVKDCEFYPDFPFTLGDIENEEEKEEKSLSLRERGTLLTIIEALLNSKDWSLEKHGLSTLIARETEKIGSPVSDDTVRRILRQVRDTLESRRK